MFRGGRRYRRGNATVRAGPRAEASFVSNVATSDLDVVQVASYVQHLHTDLCHLHMRSQGFYLTEFLCWGGDR